MRHPTIIAIIGLGLMLTACASQPTMAVGEATSVIDASYDASDLSTDTSSDKDLHRRACALAYQTYDPVSDTFLAKPGVRARCTL